MTHVFLINWFDADGPHSYVSHDSTEAQKACERPGYRVEEFRDGQFVRVRPQTLGAAVVKDGRTEPKKSYAVTLSARERHILTRLCEGMARFLPSADDEAQTALGVCNAIAQRALPVAAGTEMIGNPIAQAFFAQTRELASLVLYGDILTDAPECREKHAMALEIAHRLHDLADAALQSRSVVECGEK